MEAMALGFAAFVLLAISGVCRYCGKFVWGIICGAAAVPLTYLAAALWNDLLAESGKDTVLLGWERYPAAVVVLVALLFAAVILVIVNMAGVVKRNQSRKKTPMP